MLVFLHLLSSDIQLLRCILLNSSLLIIAFITYLIYKKITVDSLKISVITFMPLWHACTNSLPIMLALCSMLLPSYYAPNYAGIIGSGLLCMGGSKGNPVLQNVMLHSWKS